MQILLRRLSCFDSVTIYQLRPQKVAQRECLHTLLHTAADAMYICKLCEVAESSLAVLWCRCLCEPTRPNCESFHQCDHTRNTYYFDKFRSRYISIWTATPLQRLDAWHKFAPAQCDLSRLRRVCWSLYRCIPLLQFEHVTACRLVPGASISCSGRRAWLFP